MINRANFFLRNTIKFQNHFTKTKFPKIAFDIENEWLAKILECYETGAAKFAGEDFGEFSKKFQNPKILDVGSKSFFYAKTYSRFYKKHWNEITNHTDSITGIEIDPWKMAYGLKSRYDFGKEMEKNVKGVKFIAGDFLEHRENADFIFFVFPFVTKYSMKKWGLPEELFKPSEMIMHARELLNLGGHMIFVNHGEEEKVITRHILKDNRLKISESHAIKLPFWRSDVFLTIASK